MPIERDVWQHPYRYWSDGNTFAITSLGSDGKPGGEGDAADIVVTSEAQAN